MSTAVQPLLDEEKGDAKAIASSKNQDDPDSKIKTALSRRSFHANIILVLGYLIAFIFQVYELNGRARETIAVVLYFVGFALLVLSGLIELSLDIFSIRLVKHGRYHSSSGVLNRVISYLFIAAGTLDIVAFVYWLYRKVDIENRILLVSSYVLLVMAVLALYFQVAETWKVSWNNVSRQDRIDFYANMLVLVATLMGVVLRHMNVSGTDMDTADKLELATFPIWLFSSMLYVVTDVIRLELQE